MYGIDISKWQNNIDLSADNYDFAIIKATEGATYTDPSFFKFAEELKKLNKLIGCYHFARPDNQNTPELAIKEIDNFLDGINKSGLLGKSLLVIDWETPPIDREDILQAMVKELQIRTGITPFIYANESTLKLLRNTWSISNCPIWIAKWVNDKNLPVGSAPNSNPPTKFVDWSIWQYCSTGRYNKFKSVVDLNFCSFGKDEWEKLSKPEERITPDMEWAINYGIFRGDGKGNYRVKDVISKEELATVLRRYTDKLTEYMEARFGS